MNKSPYRYFTKDELTLITRGVFRTITHASINKDDNNISHQDMLGNVLDGLMKELSTRA